MQSSQTSGLSELKEYIKYDARQLIFLPNSSSLTDLLLLKVTSMNQQQAHLIFTHCKSLTHLEIINKIDQFTLAKINLLLHLVELKINIKTESPENIEINAPNLQILQIQNHRVIYNFKELVDKSPMLKSFGLIEDMPEKQIELMKGWKHLEEVKMIMVSKSFVFSVMENLPQLTSISMILCHIRDQDLKVIATINKNLKKLEMSVNNITSSGIQSLIELQNFQKLMIDRNPEIDDVGTTFIANHLPFLTQLSLSGDQISKQSFFLLSISLKNLQKLTFYGFSYQDEKMLNFNQSLKNMKQLKYFRMRFMFNNKTAQVIAENMKCLETLVLLYGHINFGDSGCFYLGMSNGKNFEFKSNKIGGVGLGKLLRNTERCNFEFYRQNVTKKARRNAKLMNLSRHYAVMI